MQYQIVLHINAVNDEGKVSKSLLPPVVALEYESMLSILLSIISFVEVDDAVATLGMENMFTFADKIQADVESGKYKFE